MSKLAESLEPPVPQEEIDAAGAEIEKAAEKSKETPTDAPKAEDKTPEDKPEEKKDKKHKYTDEEGNPLVRLDALHESRAKERAARQEMLRIQHETAQRMALLDQRLQMLHAAQNPPPDESVDPVGALKYRQEMSERELMQFRQRAQSEEMQRQQLEQVNALVAWAQSESAQFKSETPDFDDAYKHVRDKRVAELRAMGLDGPQLAQTLVQDELWVFQHAAQTGRNPAEVIYAMAKNIGYGGKQAPSQVTPEKKMEVLQSGLAAAKSLDGGAGAGGKPTAEQIANMSEDEFADLMKKYGSLEKALA